MKSSFTVEEDIYPRRRGRARRATTRARNCREEETTTTKMNVKRTTPFCFWKNCHFRLSNTPPKKTWKTSKTVVSTVTGPDFWPSRGFDSKRYSIKETLDDRSEPMSSNPFRSIIEATAPEESVTFRSPIIEATENGNESTEKIAEVRLLINRLRELVGEDVVDQIADIALEKARTKCIVSSRDSRTPQVVATSAPLHGILASQSSMRKSTSLGTGRRVSIQDTSNVATYERNRTAASKLFATDCPSPGQVESPRAKDNTKTEMSTIRTVSPRPSTGDEMDESLSARRLSDDSSRMSGGGSSVRVRRSDRYSIEGSRFSLSGQWVLDSVTKVRDLMYIEVDSM